MRHRPGYCGFCRQFRTALVGSVAALSVLFATGLAVRANAAANAPGQGVSSEFREPVTLASKDGVLEVRLTARQGAASLDTVTKPVQNFLLFDYEVIRGAPSDGKMSGGGLYPVPTLQVFPGEVTVHTPSL